MSHVTCSCGARIPYWPEADDEFVYCDSCDTLHDVKQCDCGSQFARRHGRTGR